MKRRLLNTFLTAWLACGLVTITAGRSAAQVSLSLDEGSSSANREDQWLRTSVSGYQLMERQVHLTPQAEPKPALSVRLLPDELELLDGNAAVHYLQALAFAEQQPSQQAMSEFSRKSRLAAEAAGRDFRQAEPYVWLETSPENLPVERVREYLQYSSFQLRYLEQAVLRRHCDFDRNIRAVDNPIGYLLPEIQAMRELARLQSMRFRLALAEDRPLDAVNTLGQQLAMGRHLDDEQFLVSNLVGIAVASIGVSDAYYLSEHAATPNLYWAIAALPQPLVDLREALAYERELPFDQIKQLREVDETPQPAIYWQRFIADTAFQLKSWRQIGSPQEAYSPAGTAALVAMAYPGAKLFLIDELGMEQASVDALPVTQVVVLAIRRAYEQMRDEVFKVQYLPATQRHRLAHEQSRRKLSSKYGWITVLSDLFLPAIDASMAAQEHLQQQLALLQTIESLRDYLAKHDGQLPQQLSELHLPAPNDPVTQQPFEYLYEQGRAKLSGAVVARVKYELELVPQGN